MIIFNCIEYLENGKLFERGGRKATGLRISLYLRQPGCLLSTSSFKIIGGRLLSFLIGAFRGKAIIYSGLLFICEGQNFSRGDKMKKLLGFVMALLISMSMFSGAAFAEEPGYDKVVIQIEKNDEKIHNEIEKAVAAADELKLKYEKELSKASKDNAEILLAEYNMELDKIIDKLIEKTSDRTQRLIEDAAKQGIELEPVWVEIEIGGRTVLVDPCRVRSL